MDRLGIRGTILTKVLPTKESKFVPQPARTIEWLGGVSYENLALVNGKIKKLLDDDPKDEIHLVVSSFGGSTGIGMSFLDTMRNVLKPKLVTIGSGDVDSSGILILLAGSRRYLTRNTTMLLHLAGRTFEANKRFSTREIGAMLKEDKLKDYQYACVLSEMTEGRCTPEKILRLMARTSILTPEEAVRLGLAHRIIS